MFRITIIASVCIALQCPHWSHSQIRIGAIGDSLIDEHFDQAEFGTGLGYSKNALELLIDAGQIDMGPLGNWGGTRGTGYAYNWALAGATTESLIASGQHTNLAAQVGSENIDYAIMIVGSNDLFPFLPSTGSNYEAVYEGLATTAEINTIVDEAVERIALAADALLQSGVQLVVATAPDYGISPFAQAFYPDFLKRERVDNVLHVANLRMVQEVNGVLGIPVADVYELSKDIWGDHGQEKSTFRIGGVDIDLDGTGGVSFADVVAGSYNPANVTSDAADAFVHDGIHPNNVMGAVIANLISATFNQEFGTSLDFFTEQEILASAGPGLGAQYSTDTLVNSLGGKDYEDYILTALVTDTFRDFDSDGDVDADDIDFYGGRIGQAAEGVLTHLDQDDDGFITLADHNFHVETYVETSNGEIGAILGDANLDGTVNVLGDAFALVGNLGASGSHIGWADGDFNADQQVSVLGDAFVLVGNLGLSNNAPLSPSTTNVPEPGANFFILVALHQFVLRRRYKRS